MAPVQRYLVEADWQHVERHHFRPAYALRDILWVVAWTAVGTPVEVPPRPGLRRAADEDRVVVDPGRFRRTQATLFGRRQPAPGHIG